MHPGLLADGLITEVMQRGEVGVGQRVLHTDALPRVKAQHALQQVNGLQTGQTGRVGTYERDVVWLSAERLPHDMQTRTSSRLIPH